MASYEVDHGITASSDPTPNPRRPDMSSFFAIVTRNRTSDPTHNNLHAVPTPVDVAAAYDLLADSYTSILNASDDHHEQLPDMIAQLVAQAQDPPREIKGVDQQYLDSLERVSKRSFGKEECCPICTERFRDDPHPLVVELPCHRSHRFDLECVSPWLLLQGTCPLDRKDLTAKKEVVVTKDDDDEEEDDGGMYA